MPIAPPCAHEGINKSFGAVHVLRGCRPRRPRRQRSPPSSVTTAPARAPSSRASPASTASTRASIIFEGEPVHVPAPKQASALGIEVVYQDLALCDNLDVVHNMFLGREQTQGGLLDETTMEQRATETLAGLSVRTAQVRPAAGREPLRWPAADRRHRPRRPVELQGRHPRRADRSPRCRTDRAGAAPGPPARRQRPGRHPDQPQPERRLPGRRRHRGALPRRDGRPGRGQDVTQQQVVELITTGRRELAA